MNSTIPKTVAAVLSLAACMPALASAPDHGALDRVLRASVREGRVDYASLRDSRDLAHYVTALATATPSKLSQADRLAFWINAYNAIVLKCVVDHPSIKSPLDVPGFFDKRRHRVAGAQLTLNQIEHEIIRREFKDPLIHFGLVCAALSCPPIIGEAYRGRTVQARLAENARRFLASAQNTVDIRRRTIALSKIFEWYRDDFGGETGLRRFLRLYGTKSMREVLDRDAAIVYREYDWRLNAR